MLQRRKNSSLITDFFRKEGVKRNAVELIKRQSERSCLFNAMFCFMYGRPSKCLIGVLQKLLNFFTMLWTSQRCQFVAFIVFLVCCTTNSIFGIDCGCVSLDVFCFYSCTILERRFLQFSGQIHGSQKVFLTRSRRTGRMECTHCAYLVSSSCPGTLAIVITRVQIQQ